MIHLKFIHVFACVGLFPFIVKLYSTVWTEHNFFIHLPIDGHLRCFQSGAFVNKAAMEIFVQMILWTYFSLLLSEMELLGHTVRCMFNLS